MRITLTSLVRVTHKREQIDDDAQRKLAEHIKNLCRLTDFDR